MHIPKGEHTTAYAASTEVESILRSSVYSTVKVTSIVVNVERNRHATRSLGNGSEAEVTGKHVVIIVSRNRRKNRLDFSSSQTSGVASTSRQDNSEKDGQPYSSLYMPTSSTEGDTAIGWKQESQKVNARYKCSEG